MSTRTPAASPHQTGSARSADGTTIGFRTVGSGPGLVLLHGAMQSAASHGELARLLAAHSTVHVVDRRGRGLSGPYPSFVSTQLEVDDLAAVLDATGARTVLGVSSGALIALRAALSVPAVERLVLFEPPLLMKPLHPTLVRRYADERAAGDLPAAMVTAMSMSEMGPAFLRVLPRSVLIRLTRSMLAKDERKRQDGRPALRQLAELVAHDIAVVVEQTGTVTDFAGVHVPTLLLNGTRTRPYLKAAVQALAHTLPEARSVELRGLDHGATQDKAEWGKPQPVAAAVLDFLAP